MIKIIKTIYSIIFFICFMQISFAQTNPTYTLVAKNFNRSAPDSIVFDVYMLHTNLSTTNFQYALGQYFFKFNNAIANGGTLTYRIIDSELPVNARPRNPTVINDELRLATNPVFGFGNGPAISANDPGTLIVRLSLKTTAPTFTANQSLNLQWKNSNQPAPFTKAYAYITQTMLSTEITTPETHIIDDKVSINQISTEVPDKFKLSQNFPNPFNPSTKINFSISKSGFVSLKVYDIAGREVADLVNEKLNVGVYEYIFDALAFSSGTYFYRILAGDFIETRRMVLIK